jgi:hypothetical protein
MSNLPEVYIPPNRDPPEVWSPPDPEPFPKAPDNEGLQVVTDDQDSTKKADAPGAFASNGVTAPKTPGGICGLRRSIFWLVFAVAAAVVTIAILGGVLGSVLTARNQGSSDSQGR